ncbi:MAG: type II secretion system protein [Planctomycetota bacterium]|nr:MAG: type II secretion system protein [Planctomycetota bacterium]
MRRTMPITETHRPRGGFSLVEMLVVMAIIAILASLTFVAVGASGNAAREAATKTAIRVLSSALRERVDAFQEATAGVTHIDYDVPLKLKNHSFRAKVAEFKALYQAAYDSGDNTVLITPLQAEVFVRKTMFKLAFPQRIEDMYGYDDVAGTADDSPMLSRITGSVLPTDWQSSEILYLTLTQGDVFGLPPADIGGIDQNLIGDTDNDGRLEFLDGWRHSLEFYNWPTRLLKDDGASYTGKVTVGTTDYTTSSLLISNLPSVTSTAAASATTNRNRIDRDPADVTRALNPTSSQTPSVSAAPLMNPFFLKRGTAAAYAAMPFTATWYHDSNTASSPLIVSAGQDGILGLHLPTESGADRLARVIHTDEACLSLSDNITNQQRGPQ